MKRTHPDSHSDQRKPKIIILGKDASGRPCAAWFDGATAAQAAAAAVQHGYRTIELPDAQKELAAKLPRGRLLLSGRLRLQRVSSTASDALTQLELLNSSSDISGTCGPNTTPVPAAAQPLTSQANRHRLPALVGGAAPVQTAPHDFDEVGPGSLVLARDEEAEGWYEAIVVLAQGDHLWLRWRDYPRERQIQRERHQLALLHPKAA